MECQHRRFGGKTEVGRIIDKDPVEFVIDVEVFCEECGLQFLFNDNHFAVSADRRTLRYKLKPSPTKAKRASRCD